MTKFNVSHEEAFLHVQSRRFCINPNLNFQRQMDAYEDIHSASLAMTQYMAKIQANGRPNGSASMQATHRRKRDTETDSGDETLQIDEDLRDRNLHAQRKRLASPGGGVHHFVGEQSM